MLLFQEMRNISPLLFYHKKQAESFRLLHITENYRKRKFQKIKNCNVVLL